MKTVPHTYESTQCARGVRCDCIVSLTNFPSMTLAGFPALSCCTRLAHWWALLYTVLQYNMSNGSVVSPDGSWKFYPYMYTAYEQLQQGDPYIYADLVSWPHCRTQIWIWCTSVSLKMAWAAHISNSIPGRFCSPFGGGNDTAPLRLAIQ